MGERERTSEEIDALTDSLKKSIKDQKANEKAQIYNKLYLMLKPIFSSYKLLGKTSLSNSDIGEFEEDIRLENLYNRVQATIDDSLVRYRLGDSPVVGIFKLYDTIIRQITAGHRCWLYVIDISVYLSAGLAFTLILRFFEPSLLGIKYTWVNVMTGIVSFFCILYNRVAESMLMHMDFKLKMKTKMTLMIMVYYKLIISDLSFLQAADNNLIYRLFYWDADEYSNYMRYFQVSIIFFPTIIIYAILKPYFFDWMVFDVLVYTLLALMLITSPLIAIRAAKFWKYREMLTKERQVLYEFLSNCKGVTYENLICVYREKVKDISKQKYRILRSIHLNFAFVQNIGSSFYATSLVALTSVFLFTNWSEMVAGKVIDKSHPFASKINYRSLVGFICIHSFVFQRLRRFFDHVESFIRVRSSKSFYDSFFQNDYIVHRSLTQDSTIGIGEISIQQCSVYERNYKVSYTNFESVFGIGVPETKSSQQPAKENISQFDSQHSYKDTIQLVLKDFTFRISPGDRVCIYLNKQMPAIQGFIKLLIGENIVSSGSIRCNGSISYFSVAKNPFLVGKTIRDNILFGEHYDTERYELVLTTILVNFDQYRGRDFYQVAEKAFNIKTDDRLNILLARFLYRDCNIYVVEDLFVDVNFALIETLIDRVFRGFLQGKTVIYAANSQNLLDMATAVLRFSSNYRYSVKIQKIPSPEAKTGEKMFTSKGKIKNSIFLENASYEEELAIHKKLQKQKKEIEQKRIQQTNIFEKIAYGIYLTNKRRQEGKNIEDNSDLDPAILADFMKKLIINNKSMRKIFLMQLFCSFLLVIMVVYVEYLVMVDIWSPSLEIHITFKSAISILSVFILAILFRSLATCYILSIFLKCIKELHDRIIETILSSRYKLISRMKFHDTLNKTNENLTNLEINMFNSISMMCEQFVWLILVILTVIHIFSYLIPAILITIFGVMLMYVYRRLFGPYIRAISFVYYNQYKKDDFNFQLLSMIFGHRITNRIQTLNNKFLRLSSNLARSERLAMIDFRVLFMWLATFLSLGLVSLFIVLTVLYRVFPNMNLMKHNQHYFVWSISIIYRAYIRIDLINFAFLDFSEMCLNLFRIYKFIGIEKHSITNTPKNKKFSYSPPQPNFKKPLIFRHVSLTLGYKAVLKRINIKIRPMLRVAILGFEGGGRSSLFDLIIGTKTRDDIEQSAISVFGVKLEELEESEGKKHIYYLGRDTVVFEGSIRQNIDPFGRHSTAEIIDVLKLAGIDKVLKREMNRSKHEVRREELPVSVLQQDTNMIMAIEEVRLKPQITNREDLKVRFGSINLNKIVPIPRMGNFQVQSAQHLGVKKRFPGERKSKVPFKRVLKQEKSTKDLPDRQIPKLNNPEIPLSSNRRLLARIADQEQDEWQITELDPPTKKPQPANVPSKNKSPLLEPPGFSSHQKNQELFAKKYIRSSSMDGKDEDRNQAELQAEDSESSDEDQFNSLVEGFNPKKLIEDNSIKRNSSGNETNNLTPILCEFLKMRVAFAGRNIEKPICKVISFARAVLEKPKLILLYEDAIHCGQGVAHNVGILRSLCPDSTVIAITRSNRDILRYDQVILMDGGMVIDQGDPSELMLHEQSLFYKYLKETDHDTLLHLKKQLEWKAKHLLRTEINQKIK